MQLISQIDRFESIPFEVGDARTYRAPEEPIVLFFFNPFGWETMRAFFENNIDTLKKTKSFLLYANDICINEILNYGKLLSRDDYL
jgi:hypothetical protein